MSIPNPVLLLVPYRFSTGSNSGSVFSQLPTDGTGDFTYTRPGSASFVGSNGNIQYATSHSARILNYYSGSGTCPAFLIEPSAQNICLQSQNFLTTWSPTNAAITTGTSAEFTAPDGTTGAYSLADNATNGRHRVQQSSLSFTSGTTYSLSIFIKKNSSNRFLLLNGDSAFNAKAALNLDNLAITNINGSGAAIENYGNGWYRFSIRGTASTTQTTTIFVQMQDTATDVDYIGNGSSFYLWGAQLEVGSVATSYIPTTTAAVTRNADVTTDTSYTLPIPNGTIYTEHFASFTSSYYAHSVGPIPITTGSNRVAVSYTPSKIAVYKNGSFLMSQSIGIYEVGGSIINLGHSSGSYQLNNNLLAFAVYNSELSPADAISLTSGSL